MGFTLLEAMLSVVLFGMLMIAVASVWRVGWLAAARGQREGRASRNPGLVMERLAQAVRASVFRPGAAGLFAWRGSADGRVSFVTALAPDATGAAGEHAPLERVLTSLRPGGRLAMSAGPYTMGDGDWARETVLIPGVAAFRAQFWNRARKEWLDEWADDGQPPGGVRFALALEGEPVPSDFDEWKHAVTVALEGSALHAQGGSTRNGKESSE